jgi:sugar fermentation stimulation protein A
MLSVMVVDALKFPKIEFTNEGKVISRPNRFLLIAEVIDDDGTVLRDQKVHVHDPGRLKEIIFPGNSVRLRKAHGENRKTKWDLIFGNVNGKWVLVNSSFHRYIATTLLEDERSPIKGGSKITPEVKVGSSRLDFLLDIHDGSRCYVEVKGCTLAVDGNARFPEAPTSRGTRHLKELIKLKEEGHDAAVIILVLAPNVRSFSPNWKTDPEFAQTMKNAYRSGVKIFPVDIDIIDGNVVYNGVLPLELSKDI